MKDWRKSKAQVGADLPQLVSRIVDEVLILEYGRVPEFPQQYRIGVAERQ
jgi:hypothetical protein